MKRVQRWQRSAFVVILFGLASACASTSGPKRSTLQQRVGQPGGLGAAELRLWLYELPPRLAGMVETAADRIRAESSDYPVERRALLWKADGIPTIYTAALRPDPLAGALDLWVLLYQMQDYFQDGAGKDAFGPQQPIAVEALRSMLALVSGVAESLYTDPDAYVKRKTQVQEFARAHPIEGAHYSARETALVALARLAEPGDSGFLSGFGEATDTLADISLRLNAYVTLLPKVASWQAELTSEGVTGRENLGRTLDQIDAIGEMAHRASSLLADLPGAARQASGPLGELLDRQRVELLAAVERERHDLTGFVSSEREAALSAVSNERRAALEGVARERAAALAGVDGIAKRSLEDATVRVRGVVDYVFVRALILIALGALFFAVAYRLARGGRGSPRAADA
jgi:hypothetical protein